MGKSGGWWPAQAATAPFIQTAGREDSALLRHDVTADKEEKDQCRKMHSIIKEYGLYGEFRWLVAQKDPVRNGELYRYIAGSFLLLSCLYALDESQQTACTAILLPPRHRAA